MGKQKVTRRERFLAEMDAAVPWARLVALIEPFYPKGARGRPPLGVERMLRVYCLQQWSALADEALEDALYDSRAMRAFVGGDVVPDATTLLKFRHRLERHDLTKRLFAEVNALLAERGAFLREGTIVDATIIAAAPSTKNKAKERDPEMHQTKKGNAWHFGRKAHVGVDLDSGLVHTVVGTAANVADVAQAHALLHGEEKVGVGDAGYQGVEKRTEIVSRFTAVRWYVAAKRSKVKTMAEGKLKAATQALEKPKRRCAPTLNTLSTASKTSSSIARRATGAWPRIRRSYTRFLRWQTWCSSNAPCGQKSGSEPSKSSTNVPGKSARASGVTKSSLPKRSHASLRPRPDGYRRITAVP